MNDYEYIDDYATPTMVINKEFNDFNTCFRESEESIYKKMLDVYENIKDPEHDTLMLMVLATIDSHPFCTDFPINKTSSIELMTVIIPFFEKKEDYEICDRALKLYQRFNR